MLLPRRRRVQAAIFVVLSVAGTLVTLLPQLAAPAAAAETASVAPLSWDVIGLDSNRPQKSTPHVFPVAARFCNTGAALTGAYAQLSLTTSGNSSTIDYSGPSTGPTLNLAAGACTDAFFHVQVNQSSQSFGQTDGYTLALKDSGGTAVASRTGTLYVQKLISQNRNSVTAITSPACDSSAMSCTFATGGTYTITLWSHSAPNGFEQSESFLDLPTGYLTVDSVKTYYSVPKGYRGEGVWGNGCGWNPTTRACDGTGAYTGLSGGRVGGTSIRTVYTVTAGATAGSSTPGVQGSTVTGGLRGVIYDLSGASFHYNANATDNSKAYSVSVVKGADLGVTSSHGAMVVNTQGTYTLTVTNNGPSTLTGGTTKVVDTLPAGFTYVSASAPSGWSCSAAGATVTCNRTWSGTGSLASGAAQSITLTVKPTAAGAYVNSAAVSVDTSATPTYVDPVAANNQAADPTTVATDATQYDLQLAMAGSAGFTPGQSGTYTVTASNGGPAPTGSPVTVADTLPTGVTFRSASGTGWDCGGTAPGASTVTCTYGSALSPGASAGVLTLTVDVGTSVASGWVTDTATASSAGSGTDAYPGNDTASVRTPVSSADLSVALSDGGSFPIGGTGSFTAAVTNSAASASAAQGVRLVDTLPSGLTYNPAGTSGGGFACSASGQVVTCTRAAALDVGVTVDLVLGVNVTATSESPVLDQVAVDTAAAGSTGGQPDGTYDPDTSNNSDMDVVTPVNQVDVALTQSATTPVTAGGTVTYTLTVTNNSTASPATDVFWSDVIPANVTVGTFGITSPSSGYTVPSTANACSYSGSEVDCVLGTLPASAVVTSTFTVTTASTTPNPAAATATAYLDQVDTAPANNTAGASTVVNGGTTPPAVTISGPTSVDESSTAARGYSWTASYSSAIASGQVTTSCGDAGTKVAGSDSTFTAAATVAGTFSCLFDDGSAGLTSAPSATVTMPIGTSGSSISGAASAAVSVANVAPTATLAVPTSLATGAPFTLSLAGPSDPSATDTTAGFTYAFDCGTGALGDFGPAASATCAAPSAGGQLQVRGAVEDKDGGVSTYSATVTVTGPAVAITDGATEVAESATAPHTYAWSASATSPVTSGEVVTSCGSAGAKVAGSDTFASGSPATGTFACTFDDGAAGTTSTVSATLAVPGGGTATGSTTVAVDNVDPTATIAAPATALTGGRFDLSLGSPSDPSSADSTAGFTYAFDCGTGTLGAYGSSSSTSCTAPATAGDLTVKASVRDKDGGAGTYSAVVSVSAPAPVVTPDPGTSTGPGTPTPVVNPDPGATTGSGTPTPPVDARLQVTVAADVAGITAGTGVGFTVSASNPGTAAATDVRLADVLPAAAGTVWTVDPSSGAGAASCGVASGSLVCTTSSLAAGASFTARITSPTTDDTCAASPVIDSAGLSAGNVAPGTSASAQVAVDCTGTLTGTVEDSQGTPLAGSSVTACPGGVQPPPVTGLGCAAAVNTDPAGYFTIGDLPAGDYEVRILSLAGAQTVNVTVAPLTTTSTGFIHLSGRLQRLPDRLSVSTPAFGTQTAAALGSDLPNVLATEQATVEQSGACVGAVDPTFTVWAPDPGTGLQVPVPFATNLALSEVAPGDYRGTVPALGRYNGSSRIVMTLSCQGAPIDFGVYVDPSGVILDANGAPLAGATVTLLQSPSGAPGTYTPVPDGSPVMSPANRTNPWVTGADGGFGWDVVAGFYQLTASKPGCTAASSAPFAVPPALANVTLSLTCTPAPAPAPPAAAPAPAVVPTVARIAGPDRVATSVAVSQSAFAAGSATAVVLARSDLYPDGLAGGPLAAAKVGPLLLTPPRALDARTAGEIRRVLPRRATVYLLGLTDALSASVASQVSALGYSVVRIGGPDRFATSVAIAGYIGAPAALFTTTGLDFADALSVSAAASKVGGAIVLTAGPSMPGVVAAYLSAHRGLTRYAVGGPAASADPGAQAIAGADRFVTAASVATRFFPGPTALGVATADDFADALCASPVFGRLGAPVLLSQAASLPSSVSQLVGANRGSLVSVDVFGGTAAVGQSVLDGLGAALGLAPSTPSVARNLRHA